MFRYNSVYVRCWVALVGMEIAGKRLSIVVPVYNEAGNVPHLVARLRRVLMGLGLPSEILLIDDGSRDETWDTIQETVRTSDAGPDRVASRIIGCRLSRNFGHQGALLAGYSVASGDAVISMDGDLQHPPEVVPKLVAKWQEGYEIVNTTRIDSERIPWFKRVSSDLFYKVFSALADVDLERGSSDFRLLDRKVLEQMMRLRENTPFLRGTVEWVGFRKAVVAFQVGDRFSGRTKYTLRRMLRFAGAAVVSHSVVPLRLGVWIGTFTSLAACLELIYVVTMWLTGRTVPGWASILIIQSAFFGVVFVLLGVIGIYLAEIFRLLQSRPNFIIAELLEKHRSDEAVFSAKELVR